MKHIQTGLAVVIFLICAPAFADDANDPFQEVVAKYHAANPKPRLPEEARKYKVQAEFAVQKKLFDQAAELYGQALDIAPWWPEGHYNRALILGEMNKYRAAMGGMKRYLLLVPDAPDAHAAQDRIYQWEVVAEPDLSKLAVIQDCPECPVMVALPAGSFDMGSNNGEADEKPVHRVTIAKPFAIGKTEVTQGQWQAIMGSNPSKFSGGLFSSGCGLDCPVEQVSWDDAHEFIQKLNAKTGKQYRLPSEAEWEYACRAGGQQEYCGSDSVDSVAWYGYEKSGKTTHPVAGKQANAFGLYDMSGNVWEWVEDCYNGDCAKRVLRGGSWNNGPHAARAATRLRFEPRYSYFGFRLARMLP